MIDNDLDWPIHRVDNLGREALRATGKHLSLPYLTEFVESILPLQEMRLAGNLRDYLQRLVESRSFTVVSPLTGEQLVSGHSAILDDKTIFFSLLDDPTICIVTGDLGKGMPICGAVLAEQRCVLKLFDTDWGISQRKNAIIARAMARSDWKPHRPEEPLTMVLGDFNFAHYAWNQLSTLEDLAISKLPPDIRWMSTGQPLGPVDKLFPELRIAPPVFIPDARLPTLNQASALIATPGGLKLSRRSIDRVLRYAKETATDLFHQIDDELRHCDGPVLWMSVRTTNRTAVNQHDALSMIAYCFLMCHPSGSVVVDGFSLADDLEAYPSYNRDPFKALANDDREAAEAIQSAVRRCLGYAASIHVAVGLKVPESILLASRASIYFCHHGTVQHKIGWFHPTPGMVHCNREVLSSHPDHWVADQSEVAVLPCYIDAHLVDDSALSDGNASPYESLLRHGNYLFVDLAAMTNAFFLYADETGRLPPTDTTALKMHIDTFKEWSRSHR